MTQCVIRALRTAAVRAHVHQRLSTTRLRPAVTESSDTVRGLASLALDGWVWWRVYIEPKREDAEAKPEVNAEETEQHPGEKAHQQRE